MGYGTVPRALLRLLSAAMPSAPYKQFLPDWRQRLRALMASKGENDRSLAMKAGLGYTTVNEWFRPAKNKTPSFASISAVMKVLGTPIDYLTNPDVEVRSGVQNPTDETSSLIEGPSLTYATLLGSLQLGAWQDQDVNAIIDIAQVPTVPHLDFSGVRQYAWRIQDESMAQVLLPGVYVVGVAFEDIRKFRPLMPRDLVVCARRDGNRIERTLRRVARMLDRYELFSEPERPHAPTVWPLPDDPHDRNGAVAATHLIIGAFQFLA